MCVEQECLEDAADAHGAINHGQLGTDENGGMWLEVIVGLAPGAVFAPPATEGAIRECEQVLGRPFPDDLVGLLRETSGVEGDEYGLGLVWPVEVIASENIALRTASDYTELFMPFDPLLFFADTGNGDLFAFALTQGRPEVFAWDHEDDSRRWVAPNLDRYLTWWLDGTLTI